ncbi:MAG: helix-turn-helix domain-containing protein [Psychrilyobacter sp.]|nr:helix-turn-helix domain-containing protein [Psychrilyobacter sp.]
MTFHKFIKEKRLNLNLSQNKFAKLIGITQSYFNNIERGELKNPPSDDVLEKIAMGLKLNEEENNFLIFLAAFEKTPQLIKDELEKKDKEINFLRGNSSMSENFSISVDDQIPVFERISAGLGVLGEQEVSEYLSIPGVRNHGNIFAVNVWGDSMEPTIKDGSIIIAKKEVEVRNGDVGAFFINDEAFVKRLKVTDSYIALISDNPNYPPIFIGPGEDLKIVGKVVKVLSDI